MYTPHRFRAVIGHRRYTLLLAKFNFTPTPLLGIEWSSVKSEAI